MLVLSEELADVQRVFNRCAYAAGAAVSYECVPQGAYVRLGVDFSHSNHETVDALVTQVIDRIGNVPSFEDICCAAIDYLKGLVAWLMHLPTFSREDYDAIFHAIVRELNPRINETYFDLVHHRRASQQAHLLAA